MAQTDSNSEQKAAELESVRTRIKDIENSILTARNEADQFFRELQENEVAAATVSERLQKIEQQIDSKVTGLVNLNLDKKAGLETLDKEREYLAEQIRAAYKMGRNDYLKLLLNQENPALVGRMLGYYDYYNRVRTSRIDRISESIEEMALLEQNIQTETRQLDRLREEQLRKLEEFAQSRISRGEIIARLENYIDEQGEQLQILQQDELELESLVNSLRKEESIVQIYEDMPPFNSLRGKLKWPAQGQIATRFGALRKGGKLKWQGVTINAENGTDVRAISPGKVIFADWFRNMGLLIILDHGEGFMSLYGHNERLMKKVGDWVPADETIAKVGDTGGQQQPNLYFEIRQGADPVNPGLWCGL